VVQQDTVILTQALERDGSIEQQLGVKFEGLTAWWQTGKAFVLGELRTLSGSSLRQNTIVQVTAFDNAGHILGWNSVVFDKAAFCGRDTFQICLDIPGRPSKLHIFPKRDAGDIIRVDRIERLEMIEERLGVRLDKLTADWTPASGNIRVWAELYAVSGMTLSRNVMIVTTAYDEDGRIIGSSRCPYLADQFAGFATYCIHVPCPALPAKVRVYPEAW
jgi:hypothetical protein